MANGEISTPIKLFCGRFLIYFYFFVVKYTKVFCFAIEIGPLSLAKDKCLFTFSRPMIHGRVAHFNANLI